ncbi:MAG: hypothetical protein EOO99_10650 [Pedobacter sp.]|nr:MAG: hypothetical protein EOO99_10650 [Pedobacter sp.]
MKLLYLLAFFGIIPLSALAQTNCDSLKLSGLTSSFELFQDSIAYNSLLQSKQSAFYLKNHIPARYSRASINYQLLRGDLMAAQDANQIQLAQLSTEGSSELGKVKLFGSLTYSKVFEDSTSYGHQTRSNPSSPYYFGAPAKIHYERTTYAFQAMAGRSFWKEKLDLSLGLDYKVGSHFSTNDPRGSLSEYQFDLQFVAAYNLYKDLKLGMGYSHGYGRESVNIGYKNPRYYESSAYPEFYNHLINGFREWDDALRNRIYDNKFLRNQIQLGFNNSRSNNGHSQIILWI